MLLLSSASSAEAAVIYIYIEALQPSGGRREGEEGKEGRKEMWCFLVLQRVELQWRKSFTCCSSTAASAALQEKKIKHFE